jgi:hypothetical protein
MTFCLRHDIVFGLTPCLGCGTLFGLWHLIWVVAPYSLTGGYQLFDGTYCLHIQSRSVTIQNSSVISVKVHDKFLPVVAQYMALYLKFQSNFNIFLCSDLHYASKLPRRHHCAYLSSNTLFCPPCAMEMPTTRQPATLPN